MPLFNFSLIPRSDKFFDLFDEGAANLLATAQALREMADHADQFPDHAARLKELESKGDGVAHRIMEELYLTFVTPLDREDIVALAHSVDDMVDFIEAVAAMLVVYNVHSLRPQAVDLIDLSLRSAEEVAKAVPKLRQRRELKSILYHCVEINRLENEADRILRDALAELFRDDADAVEIVKWKDIYEQLESTTDRGEDIADVLEGLVLKHA